MDALHGPLDQLLEMSALLSADSARFAAEHGLTEARVHVLWELHAAGPVPQHVLAARLGVAPRTVTGLVDGLVGSGHVERPRTRPTGGSSS